MVLTRRPLVPLQVGMETEGFAIYDTMMQVRNEVRHDDASQE